MSLNLGLESLGITTDDVSFESVLAAQVEMQDARASFEHAMFDLATTARNVANFNEIVGSLSKHSSVECAAFAQELLGVPSMEAAKEVKIPLEKQSKAGKKLSGWWESIKKWIAKCYNWVKKQISKLLTKVGVMTELTRNPKVKVHWKAATIAAAVSGYSAAEKTAGTEAKLEAFLKLKFFANKPTGAVLDLKKAEEARTYFQNLQKLQSEIYNLTSEFRGLTDDKTSAKALKYQSAFISRIQNTQKYILADVKAILDATTGAAAKVTGKFSDIQKKQEGLQKDLDESKKAAASV